MPGNSRNRFERLDLIERRDPLLAAFRIRLAQMKMNIIVERIAADGQSDGRDMETGCAIGIGMPERNTYELFPSRSITPSLINVPSPFAGMAAAQGCPTC